VLLLDEIEKAGAIKAPMSLSLSEESAYSLEMQMAQGLYRCIDKEHALYRNSPPREFF
jgi:hypothetical protein